MPNHQPRCNPSTKHSAPTCILFVFALLCGFVSLLPRPNLHAAESPPGEAADDNASARTDEPQADDSDENDSDENDSDENDSGADDSGADDSGTNEPSWPAEWIAGDETIAVTLHPGDGLKLRRQDKGRDVPLPGDASGRLRVGDSGDADRAASSPTVSPLQQHRARIETRRKAAMRGAWSPDQEGRRGPADENAWRNAIYLRGGDLVDGRVVSIGPSGVRFRSSRHGTATISHDRVEQLELSLLENPAAASLDETTRRRLSTIPRMQADSPPTQILVSPSGDYLRCRLTSLDDTRVAVTTHGASAEIPRDHVAQIVWLHANTEEPSPFARSPSARFRVTRWDGERLTLSGLRVEADHVVGRHESFGECRFRITELTEIAVGATAVSRADPAADPWRSIPATLPIADQQDADDQSR